MASHAADDSKKKSASAENVGNRTTAVEELDTPEREEIWYQKESKWELTWPIWHMLQWQERKALALEHGFDKIGEFEEYMTMRRAVGDSEFHVGPQQPYANSLVYPDNSMHLEDSKPSAEEVSGERDDDDNSSVEDDEDILGESAATEDRLNDAELLEVGGQILILPDEMLHRIFEWLNVDAYATLALVSPHWKSFTRTETVYKRLCERLYLNQSKRRTLHVSRFGNSYRNMLEKRPRVRAGGGVYVMKYARVKPIQRDMWTEIPIGAILETVYYRYLWFQEDGKVLYALTSAPPYDMFRRFRRMILTGNSDDAVVWGHYQVQRTHVTVTAKQSWQWVQLELSIQPNTMHGRNGYLSFDRHITSSTEAFEESDRVVYEVPGEPFRFVRHKSL